MCYEEFIAYQCGHRSMGVVRTCPMTTAGHNFPICGIPPHKPHYAETMCTPCERQLHSRWVLIREWEHRWLHERGACGCEVIFPGLLTTPRVIGHTSVVESPASTTGSNVMATADRNDATPNSIDGVESFKDSQGQTGQGGAEKNTASSKGVTETGEHRVAVRLPGLYAAEAGKCTCAATFAPYKPRVTDDELTTDDRDNLSQWRQREIREEKSDHRHGIEGQVDETTQRIAEIKKTFGELPRLPPPAAAESQTVKVRGQNQGNNTRHFNRRGENRRERNLPSRPRSQPTRWSSASPQSLGGQLIVSSQAPSPPYPPPTNQPSTQAAATATAITMPMPAPVPMGYHYPEYPHHQHPHCPVPAHPTYATATTFSDAIPAGAFPWAAAPQATPGMPWLTQGPGPYRTPGLVHARTGGNQTDTGGGTGHGGVGYNTYPQHQPHHLGGYAQGYAHAHGHGRGYQIQTQTQTHRHQRQHGGERQLAAPEGIVQEQGQGLEVEEDRGRGGWRAADPHTHTHHQYPQQPQPHQQHQNYGNTANRPEILQPLCGLPIGAGPEGVSHMPDWLECPLRRSSSVGVALVMGGEGEIEGEVPDEVEGELASITGEDGREVVRGGVMRNERRRRGAEQDEGKEREDDESDRLLTPPPPPTRRHSAAT
ncbi:uncharacterized protein B0H64DRAFT_414607 [Chaetomium fimeti]|uniref:Uncharacterized protein n=1 Tax=Chaetomium fimeti TaxID=1854472 RepID=A0AAE0LX46_9PEZI|nr:hypothetical protein B0H64DRAFT_414607 [Chaetomium fimeti]